MVDPAWFGMRLREIRREAGMTQHKLAQLAGLGSYAGVRNIEQGIRQPHWSTVVALCGALKVSPEVFMQEPKTTEAPGRGRPVKEETPVVDGPKRPRGRPRKQE